MTGKETSILVHQWYSRLNREIELLRDDLERQERRGAEVLREDSRRVYTGPTGLFSSSPTSKAESDKPENWREDPGEFRALAGLLDLLNDLETAATDLAVAEV